MGKIIGIDLGTTNSCRNCIKNEPYLMCMPDSKIG